MKTLPVSAAHALAVVPEVDAWLIEGLWARAGVGIIGGEPKCCKSFLALDMAVAVASGTPCLRHFRTAQPGRVLLYAAEDALPTVRQRLHGICVAAGVALENVDIQVITSAALRLDSQDDQQRLEATVAMLKPRLLILDPFVRLHRIDENVSGEVAPLLAYLRDLQRAHDLAVALVHHARKSSGPTRPGQALRGSSEFHAWGDSNLYLRRRDEALTVTTEHRAAPSGDPLPVALTELNGGLALQVRPASNQHGLPDIPKDVTAAILQVLSTASEPLSRDCLRQTCRCRAQTLSTALQELLAAGRISKSPLGYALAN